MATLVLDARSDARAEAAKIQSAPEAYLEGPLLRLMQDCPHVNRAQMVSGVAAFHRERMAKTPSSAVYPEAAPWVEYVLAVDHEVQALTGISDEQMAIYRSLRFYLMFRGFVAARPETAEKCRIAYLPETDQGALHIKNVDDPLTYWKPDPAPIRTPPDRSSLRMDGVGNGLHLDDEPAELFPLPARRMCEALCDDVPGAVEFLTRYSAFWGSANLLLFDGQKRSVAIEKASYNHITVHAPDPSGGSHVSGMVIRDLDSPQGRYVEAKRRQYMTMFGLRDGCSDHAYWQGARVLEVTLAALMARTDRIPAADVIALFTTPTPDGFKKWGAKFHPDQPYLQYTLKTQANLLDQQRIYRWQRSVDGVYPEEPEVYQFS